MALVAHASRAKSSTEVKRVLTGKTAHWADGTKARLILLPRGSAPMEWLCRTILGTSEMSYRKLLLAKAFRGKIPKPLVARTPQEAYDAIRNNSGAIGPLPKTTVGEGTVIVSH